MESNCRILLLTETGARQPNPQSASLASSDQENLTCTTQ